MDANADKAVDVSLERVRSYARSERCAWHLHLASLVLGFAFLLWVNRQQWFNFDEWTMLLHRQLIGDDVRDGLLEEFNGHWQALTILNYRILYRIFGLRTYLPYLVVLAAFQTLSAHMLWRVMRRCGVMPMVATAGAVVYLFYGTGAEMLTNAYGYTNVAPVALGLAALAVIPITGSFGRRDVAVWALLIAGLMYQSGAAVPFLVVVGAVVLFTRGLRTAAAVVSVPAVVFGVWYVAFGRFAENEGELPFFTGLERVVAFVWRGLTETVDETTGLLGIAPVLLVLVAAWVVLRTSPRGAPMVIALALAGGAVTELVLINFGRGAFGTEIATSPRYLLILLPMLLPLFGLAASAGLAHARLPLVLIGLVTAALLTVQIGNFVDYANHFESIEQEQKRRIVAAAEVLRSDPRVVSVEVVPESLLPLSPDNVRALDRDSKLPDVAATREDRLTARAYLQLSLTEEPALDAVAPARLVEAFGVQVVSDADPGCVRITTVDRTPQLLLRFVEPGSVGLVPERSGEIALAFKGRGADSTEGRRRTFAVQAGIERFLNVTAERVDTVFVPTPGTTTMCGIAGGDGVGSPTSAP